MILANRALFVLLGCVAAATFGCSGGGGGGGGGGGTPPTTAPTATPTASGTATPTPVATATPTPVATATPTPVGSATPTPAATATPLFSYAGHTLESFVYYGSTPNPSATIDYAIAQVVSNKGAASFDGATPNEYQTIETDAAPDQTIHLTTNAFFGTAPYSGQTGSYTYGYASLDSNGQSITDALSDVTSGNGLIDILPETSGASWTNNGAATLTESETDGFTSTRTIAKNGTYKENDTYPQGSQPALTASITENSDGSGTYSFPLFGQPDDNATFTYTAPTGGNITITLSQPVDGSTQTASYVEPTWYALPLYKETDVDDGSRSIPAACNVPPAFGSSGNGIEENFTKVDTVLGTLETFDQVTYVVGGYTACTTLSDTTKIFYDYSGQGDQLPIGFAFSGGSSPVEIQTVSSTIGLQSTSVSGAFRRNDVRTGTDARAVFQRTNFLALVERLRLERLHRAALHLRSLRFERLHQ
jgi:hypothetical protein